MKYCILFLGWVLAVVTATASNINSISSDHSKEEVILKSSIVDSSGTITKDQAVLLFNGTTAAYESKHDNYWVTFDLVNNTGTDAIWFLDFDKWTEVDLYVSNSEQIKRTGHLVPFNERDVSFSNYNLIKVNARSGDTISCTAYLKKSISHFAIPSDYDIQIIEKSTFYTHQTNKRMLLGLFLGFYLIMLAYNFFIYISTRDHYYIHYLWILFALLLLTLHNSGYTFELFGSIDVYCYWNAKIQFILSAVLGVNIILFAQQFLNLKEHFPKTSKILRVITWLVVIMPLPSFLGNAVVNEAISGMLGTLTMIIIMVTAVRAARAKLPSSLYFAYGYGAFSLGIIVLLLSFMGVLPAKILDYYPMNIGSSFEMIFFSIALGNRINLLAKDNTEKQLKLIEQLKANEELQTKVNRELEMKVKERTKEIEDQKVKIEEQRDLITVEKKKADDLILNILPEVTAEELKHTGKATPRYYDSATVIFTDIVSFTQKAMESDADEIVKELDHCFCAFDDIMKKNNIEKIKTMGDGYMGVGGIPIENATHAADAIQAGLEILEFMRKFAEEREKRGKKPWGIRVGVHTGAVITGVVGKDKFVFDVWGDTVNTASRMESSGESGKVNISQSTFEASKDNFTFIHRGKILAKHKGEIDMYFVQPLNSK